MWSSYFPTFGWNDNFLRTSLINEWTYKPRPALYTYKLLEEEIGGASKVQKLAEGVYLFTKADGSKVVVAWSDNGNKIIDLSTTFTSNAKVTHIVTKVDSQENPIYLPDETISSSEVQISSVPIFIEAN